MQVGKAGICYNLFSRGVKRITNNDFVSFMPMSMRSTDIAQPISLGNLSLL